MVVAEQNDEGQRWWWPVARWLMAMAHFVCVCVCVRFFFSSDFLMLRLGFVLYCSLACELDIDGGG